MTHRSLFPIHAGYLPLLDAAILVTAKDKGFAEEEGIDLVLVRETSWASIRDRMAVGHFEVSHMLAPMPIAAALGLSPIELDVIAPLALGLGGNAITVSKDLADRMNSVSSGQIGNAAVAGKALHSVVFDQSQRGVQKLRFAVVHPHSGHNYELRYWMAAVGIDPETDVEIVVVPPPLMPEALANGQIDGCCVGEPWNTISVLRGCGEIVTTKAAIWKSSPEKVLGVSRTFADKHPERLDALLRALYRAAKWCGEEENRTELASLLSSSDRIGVSAQNIMPALTGTLFINQSRRQTVRDFFLPFEHVATFPWKSHALWFYSQMVRWGHAPWAEHNLMLAADTYRPDLYRRALAPLSAIVPTASAKVEGALLEEMPVGAGQQTLTLGPDGFFDGRVFDPEQVARYLEGFSIDAISTKS